MVINSCSQNPTGSTLPLERRRQIYQIARDWDVIILEDDPYFFLQYDLDLRQTTVERYDFTRAMAEVLPRSFLSMDYDGRVMRLDRLVLPPWMIPGRISRFLCTALAKFLRQACGLAGLRVTSSLGKN